MENAVKLVERLEKYIGQTVGVQGTFPIPVQTAKGVVVDYPAITGKLAAVYEDGIELEHPTGGHAGFAVYPFVNIRAISVVEERMVQPVGGGLHRV